MAVAELHSKIDLIGFNLKMLSKGKERSLLISAGSSDDKTFLLEVCRKMSEIGVRLFSRIDGMVHAVMTGCVEDSFEPDRQTANAFSVDPELINQVDARDQDNQAGVEAENDERKPKRNQTGKGAKPGLSQSR